MERPEHHRTLDTCGSFCPMPIIETAKVVREMEPDQILLILATDPGIVSDIPIWCKGTGHEHLATVCEDKIYRSWIRVRAKR